MTLVALGLHAQVIDHSSLLPDDLFMGDSVVTEQSVEVVNNYVEAPADSVRAWQARADSLAYVADSLAADSAAAAAAMADSLKRASVARLNAKFAALPPIPEAMRQAVYRSWRRCHPVQPVSPDIRLRSRTARYMTDTLRRSVEALLLDSVIDDMLYLYDMRLPLISSGSVPADSSLTFDQLVQREEHLMLDSELPVSHAEDRYVRQMHNEQQRHIVRYRYAMADPRRFRYARRKFEVPTWQSQTIDTRTTVQQTRVIDELDVDFSTASLEDFSQSIVIRADKWHWKGDHTLTMQQTALSDNWYKDGDNNMSLSGEQKLTVTRYDEEQKTTFETILDLKLSGYYTKADTIHSMRVNDNEFTLTSKYGYKAWKKWYYSAQLYAKTPIFDYYATNSTVCKSTFLSPLEVNLSLGVDYQYTSPNKRFTYSLLLAPLSYDMKYVRADNRVKVTSYGIKEGHTSLHTFGSSLTTKFDWKITDDVKWSSRLYYFTSYSMLKFEFENTIDFRISRFFSGKLYAYPRFDDSRDRKREIKEMLTIGFSYQW